MRRDRWGRPLVDTAEGEVAYRRVSKFAYSLSDSYVLDAWRSRMIVEGFAVDPMLPAAAAAASGRNDLLTAVVEQALAVAGANAARDLGTAVHDLLLEAERSGVAPRLAGELGKRVTAGLELLDQLGWGLVDAERFVVVDELQVGGSYDRVYDTPDGLVVADWKTGKHAGTNLLEVAIQLACYAHGTHYEDGVGRGVSLEQLGVRMDRGAVMWVPPGGSARVVWVDLVQGWELAQLAGSVLGARAAAKGLSL